MQLIRRHSSFRCACVVAKVEFMFCSAVQVWRCVFAGGRRRRRALNAMQCMVVTEMPEG